MHINSEIPIVRPETKVKDTILEITGKRLGTAVVVDSENKLTGIFTDGDLRRLVEKDVDFFNRPTGEVMTRNPKSINPEALLDEALAVMEKYSIMVLPVVDRQRHPVGIIHLHDILKSKLV